MPGNLFICHVSVFALVFSAVSAEEFGMRLTTEKIKTKENTQYLFRYFVKDDATGDYKIQEETKEGDSVRGSYTIAEPNGDLRTVTYKAGPGRGFEAKVDVQPSASPMKTLPETTPISESPAGTTASAEPTLESNVKKFPGGFIMDILSKPPSETKTEMKFSLKTNPVTEPDVALLRETSTEITETTETTENVLRSEVENATNPTEGRDISEDPIARELDEALNSLPKLPEVLLSDNKTYLKFQKDPEEALLDERISQIARQLAETSLRREYEERKLGHFIPISVRPIEPSTLGYLSKSFKFTGNDVPNFRPSEPSPLQLLTQVRVVPQYIYKEPEIPKFPSAINHRLPVINRQFLNTETQTPQYYSSETPILDSSYATTNKDLVSVMPIQVPTFLQFFSPVQRYVMHTQRSFLTTQNQPSRFYVSPLATDLTTGSIPLNDDATFYTHVSMTNDKTSEKP